MTGRSRTGRAILAFLLSLGLIVFASPPGASATGDSTSKSPYAATQLTFDYLFLVDALMRHQRFAEAAVELDGLLKRVRDNAYEQALVAQTYGYLDIAQDDYRAAIGHFRQALTLGSLPPEVNHGLRYLLAQLYGQIDDAKSAIQYLEAWLQHESNPDPAARFLAAKVYYAVKSYPKALQQLRIALNATAQPKESWLRLMVSVLIELERWNEAGPWLERLLASYPDQLEYWRQLAAVYLRGNRPRKAAAALTLANAKGLLKEPDILHLVQLCISQNEPFRAGMLLETALQEGRIHPREKHWQLLADSWLLARESKRALKALEHQSGLSQSGQADLRRAELLLGLEQWALAAKALQKAVQRGGLDHLGRAYLLLGITRHRLDDTAGALAALRRAKQYSDVSSVQQQADEWLAYLEREPR